jgi:protein TonB
VTVPDRPFAAILESQPAGLRLSGGAALVAVSYVALMVAGLGLSSGATRVAKEPVAEELVVTLFDRPPPPQLEPEPAASAPQVERVVAAARPERVTRAEPVPAVKPVAAQPTAASPEPVPTQEPAKLPAVSAAAAEPQPAAASGVTGTGLGTSTAAVSGKPSGTSTSTSTSVLAFSDGMTRPKLVDMTPPEYTREAREADVKGLFLAKCVITTAGSLQNCRVVKGLPHMDQAVLSALARWRYTPVIYQGKPVAVDYVIQVRLAGP